MKQKSYYLQYGNTIIYFLWEKHFQQFFKGVAVCQPDDTFDLETGVRIARKKAVIKMFSYAAKQTDSVLDIIEQFKGMESELREKHKMYIEYAERETNKLNEMLKELN